MAEDERDVAGFEERTPVWAGRVPRHLIERLYRTDAQGIVDEDLINEVGFSLLARVESSLTVTDGLGDRPLCPGCRVRVERDGDCLRCKTCRWACTLEAFRKSHTGNRLVAGRMEPFFRAYADEFPRARDARHKMRLIDVLIHRFHGEIEQSGMRAGAINLIGGKPREVLELLDRLAGY